MLLLQEISNILTKIMDTNNQLPLNLQVKQNENINVLLTLINDVGDYVKIESNEIILKKNKCNIRTVLQDITKIIKHKVHMSFLVDAHIPYVMILDEQRIQNILLTLMNKLYSFQPLFINTTLDFDSITERDFLIFNITSPVTSKLNNFFKIFSEETFNINFINIIVIKGLCERMKGTCDIAENKITVKVNVSLEND